MDGGALRRWLRVPWVAGLLLVLVYGALTLLTDPNGTLGSDTGIKVATVRMMDAHSTLRPDLGYWAAEWDPSASVHPYRDTVVIDGAYVDVPTLPLVLVSLPLWKVGGYRLALLGPMLGLVACAFVARGLARRLARGDLDAEHGDDASAEDASAEGASAAGSDGWAAFWLVGLTSPMVIYALDLWEHTLGVALMGGAALLVVDQVARPSRWRALGIGALLAAAFTMRTEALVYTAVFLAAAAVVLLRRRAVRAVVETGIAAAVGFVAVTALNLGLELAVIGQPIRTARAGVAAGAAASGLGVRAQEAIVTLTSPFPSFDPTYLVLGGLGAAAGIALGWAGRSKRTRPFAIGAAAVLGFVLLLRLTSNLAFWPGLFATTPLAAAGVGAGWSGDRRKLVLALGLVPLPFVFLTQFPGGALPQWGGRYLLTSAFLLMVVGVTVLPALEAWVRTTFVALSVLVTLVAVAWIGTRTHQVARAGAALAQRPEAVLVSPDGFVVREFAATYGAKDWLSTQGSAGLEAAIDVVRRSGRPTFAIVTLSDEPAPDVPGFHRTGTEHLPFVDPLELKITSYAADGR